MHPYPCMFTTDEKYADEIPSSHLPGGYFQLHELDSLSLGKISPYCFARCFPSCFFIQIFHAVYA